MQHQQQFSAPYQGYLKIDYLDTLNYSLCHNQVQGLYTCSIGNDTELAWHEVHVKLSGEFIRPSEVMLSQVPAKQEILIEGLELKPDAQRLLQEIEAITSELVLDISVGEESIAHIRLPLHVMAFDQWCGSGMLPQILASFVTPNHPLISRVLVRAGEFMQKWTKQSSLSGYQFGDPTMVRYQVAAIFEALRGEGLIYTNPPSSFEERGQRIRLVDKVLNEKLGTCLDLTLLYASCIEAIGLNPILIMVEGHAFLGVWLYDVFSTQLVNDDLEHLIKGTSDGVHDIVVVECTTLCDSKRISFEKAVRIACQQLRTMTFEYFIDVYTCRLHGIRPLPQRIVGDDGALIVNGGIEYEHATKNVMHIRTLDLTQFAEKELTKQDIWERKLLDLSLRNNLLNLRIGKRALPLISVNIHEWENALQQGKSFEVLPYLMNSLPEPNEYGIYDSAILSPQTHYLITQDAKQGRLYSYHTYTELQTALKELYRSSRTAIEENGANSLFLVLGLLSWRETSESLRPHYAPLLLLPVEIVARRGTYTLRSREEDMILNITLVEFLKQNYNVVLTGLDPLPKDEAGVDVPLIFATIRHQIRHLKGWDLLEESMLGLFSFTKFVMWNDIHNHADHIRQHPLLRALMSESGSDKDAMGIEDTSLPELDMQSVDRQSAPSDYALPIDIDSSQLEAVIASGMGKSFILHGPPGTGKSQTITNIIANALYQGKRVLFVAEKMAALSVVQQRLAEVGLAPFCLELHSNKVTKSHVLKQLSEALEAPRTISSPDFQDKGEQLQRYRHELIAYVDALHETRESGWSLHELIHRYHHTPAQPLPAYISAFDLSHLSRAHTDALIDELALLETTFRICGHPSVHPLKAIRLLSAEAMDGQALASRLQHLKMTVEAVLVQVGPIQQSWSLPCLDTPQAVAAVSALCTALCDITYFDSRYLQLAEHGNASEELIDLAQAMLQLLEAEETFKNEWGTSLANIPAKQLLQEWDEISQKWFVTRFFAKQSYLKKLKALSPQVYDIDGGVGMLRLAVELQEQRHKVSDQLAHQPQLQALGVKTKQEWQQFLQHYPSIDKLPARLLDVAQAHSVSYAQIRQNITALLSEGWAMERHVQAPRYAQLAKVYDEMQLAEVAARSWVSWDEAGDKALRSLVELLSTAIPHTAKAKDWWQWMLRRAALAQLGAHPLITLIENTSASASDISQAFLRHLYRHLAQQIIASDVRLASFNGWMFEEVIEKYRTLAKDFQSLICHELYSRLAARIPSGTMMVNAQSELGILRRTIANGGRAMSIRKLFDQLPSLLPRLCPCMLMSPLSVAQYIDMTSEKFDLVVFDEASQIPTSEAVGAMARGKAIIVVGDPKQMPPTSFFASNQIAEEDTYLDDMESVLDDCIALSLPSRYLSWHYRSKHESLIAFSNTNYYESRLSTFPSPDNQISKVQLIPVNGVYDKAHTRTNKKEAEAIIAEVARRLSCPILRQRSIGVIAFSQAQQSLIEDKLMELFSAQPDLETIVSQQAEPVFVKNLENVQGDERDVILFSIGYGPDASGKVSMNFGPLNNQGGERRLNVAVSRARYEMLVYTSLSAEQIDLRRTRSRGVEGLRSFLDFAQHGVSRLPQRQGAHQQTSAIVSAVQQALSQAGYISDVAVGSSQFRVDLAVRHPEHPDTYLLGILFDGLRYYHTKTARDRDIVQPSVLRHLGWQIYRLWTVDWFTNPERILEHLTARIEELRHSAPTAEAEAPQPKSKVFTIDSKLVVDPGTATAAVKEEYPKGGYSTAFVYNSFVESLRTKSDQLQYLIHDIVQHEAPLSLEGLYTRVAEELSAGYLTITDQKVVASILKLSKEATVVKGKDETLIWAQGQDPDSYISFRTCGPRDVTLYPMVELRNVLGYIIQEQGSLSEKELFRLASKELGFARTGPRIRERLLSALDLLLASGQVTKSGDAEPILMHTIKPIH